MKRNVLTLLIGALLLLIFGLLLFTFQVRQTEIALVTTFDKPTLPIEEPGFKFKWPPPIQKVYKFDKRIQSFEQQDKIEETSTRDKFNLVVQVYVGWTISKPDLFFSRFPAGTVASAQPTLEQLVRTHKIYVIGQHPFTDFVSTDKNQLKFTQIEQEMLKSIQPEALNNYGIDVRFLGIKKLALPESVTQKVFDRMTAERQQVIESLKSRGEAEANIIKTDADLERSRALSQAEKEATEIKGRAKAEEAKYLSVLEKNPDLANFLNGLQALEEVTKERTTLILDERTPPFNLLTRSVTNQVPAAATNQAPTNLSAGLPGGLGAEATVSRNNNP
jgi:membrane protease subunit HflC